MTPTTSLVGLLLIIFLSLNANAQKGDIALGGGLKFDISSGYYDASPDFTGINARVYYSLNDNIRLAPNLNINFPWKENSDGVELKIGLFTLNGEGHYLFPGLIGDKVTPYAIGGLSYHRFKATATYNGSSEKETASEVSLNLGTGAEYPLPKGKLFAEFKGLIGDFDPWVLAFGYMFSL